MKYNRFIKDSLPVSETGLGAWQLGDNSGWLSGKYNSSSTFNDIRSRWSAADIDTRARLVEKVKTIVGRDHDLAQTAIAFCLAYDAVSTVIPGNVNSAQLRANLQSVNQPIPAELVEKLEKFYLNEVKELQIPW